VFEPGLTFIDAGGAATALMPTRPAGVAETGPVGRIAPGEAAVPAGPTPGVGGPPMNETIRGA
jgi:hypothetical protein